MRTIKVGQRGVITLPKKVREAFGIAEGDVLGVREKNGTLVLEPHDVGNDPVLADIRKGLEDIRNGRFIEFDSIKEFEKKLQGYGKN